MTKQCNLVFLLLIISFASFSQRTIITINNSSKPIWVGAEGKLVTSTNPLVVIPHNPNNGGWYLAPNGGRLTVTVPNGWEGRFWGRTGCQFDANGKGTCETGDCGSGLYCNGLWGKASTLAEMKFNGWNNQDYYDISLIDGFNIPMQIIPVPGTFTISPYATRFEGGTAGCTTDLNPLCPPDLQIKNSAGKVIAWMATCEKFNTDQYCCYANDPNTCKPNYYSQILKAACPDAYSYVTDDPTSVFVCTGATYQVVFPEPTPPAGAGVATLYKNCNYGGTAVALPVGNYTLAQLIAKGILNDDISSIKVNPGYKVELFENDNFTGTTLTVTADNTCLVANNFNDKTTSLKISTANCTATSIIPSISINGGAAQQTSTATLNAGGSVVISPQPTSGGSWSWTGPNNFTSTSRQITLSNIQTNQTGNYVATHTNSGGCKSTHTFNITVNGSVNSFSQTVQAENYNFMFGVQTENCNDAGLGLNVGWIDPNDWMVYNVNIPVAGTYKISYRVASPNAGRTLKLEKDAGAVQLGTISIPNTGGWQTWTTISHNVPLTAGQNSLGITTATGGFNLNYFTISNNLSARTISEGREVGDDISIYPVPVKDKLTIGNAIKDVSLIEIMDLTGNRVSSFKLKKGENEIDLTGLAKGGYLIKISGKSTSTVKKIYKE